MEEKENIIERNRRLAQEVRLQASNPVDWGLHRLEVYNKRFSLWG